MSLDVHVRANATTARTLAAISTAADTAVAGYATFTQAAAAGAQAASDWAAGLDPAADHFEVRGGSSTNPFLPGVHWCRTTHADHTTALDACARLFRDHPKFGRLLRSATWTDLPLAYAPGQTGAVAVATGGELPVAEGFPNCVTWADGATDPSVVPKHPNYIHGRVFRWIVEWFFSGPNTGAWGVSRLTSAYPGVSQNERFPDALYGARMPSCGPVRQAPPPPAPPPGLPPPPSPPVSPPTVPPSATTSGAGGSGITGSGTSWGRGNSTTGPLAGRHSPGRPPDVGTIVAVALVAVVVGGLVACWVLSRRHMRRRRARRVMELGPEMGGFSGPGEETAALTPEVPSGRRTGTRRVGDGSGSGADVGSYSYSYSGCPSGSGREEGEETGSRSDSTGGGGDEAESPAVLGRIPTSRDAASEGSAHTGSSGEMPPPYDEIAQHGSSPRPATGTTAVMAPAVATTTPSPTTAAGSVPGCTSEHATWGPPPAYSGLAAPAGTAASTARDAGSEATTEGSGEASAGASGNGYDVEGARFENASSNSLSLPATAARTSTFSASRSE